MRNIPLALLFMCLLAWPVQAATIGGVVNCTESGEIVINRGANDNVIPGLHWYIYRNNKPVAEVEVVLVDSYSCNAQVVTGGDVAVGDRVTDVPFKTPLSKKDYPTEALRQAAEAANPSDSGAVASTDIPKNVLTNRNPGTPAREETAETTAKTYEACLSKSSKTHKFSGGAAKKSRTSVNPLQAANLFSATGYGGSSWTTWQNVLSVVPGEVANYMSNKKLYKDSMLRVEVIFWSEELLTSYSDMLAFREGRTSTEQRLALRSGLYAQKGLERFYVFNVKMHNDGPGIVQVEPFHWHMYLVDAQGNRVKAERYDQVLDRSLNPGQSVEGNVYFLKADSAGRPVVTGKSMTIVLEDILAERAELKF